jgi:hypothetical protein
MLEVILAPKGIMVLFLHALFLALALRRVWHKNAARLPSKIFWSLLATVIPVIGPILAVGFGRVLRPHGESTPPTRPWMGDSWTGGWR